jgi:hypothetical protein
MQRTLARDLDFLFNIIKFTLPLFFTLSFYCSQVKLLEQARLALRMVTVIKPEDLATVASFIG